jgi:VWFA-related protein
LFAALQAGGAVVAQQPAAPAPAQPAPQASAPQTPASATQEAPPVTFRVEVNYVEVDAFVTDADGKPITTLTANDFEVLEDGKPQQVSSFSVVNIPIERPERPLFAGRAVETDVQTNAAREGRIYLFVLDDNHTDFTRAPRVKAAARRFIEQDFGTNDLAAVVFTGGRSEDGQDFTNNPRLLLAAIDKFIGRKLESATIERLNNLRVNPSTGNVEAPDDPSQMDRAFRARSAMSTIRKLAEFMAGVRGRRKALLLIGEGVDYNIYEAVGPTGSTASSVLQDTHDAIAAATRGNVSIYAIDPRGLSTGSEDLITVAGTAPGNEVGLASALAELRLSQDSLRVLAANTGGFAAVNQNDFNTAFDRIVAENSSYYVLGYYATNERRDGRYRKLEVRMKRPGYRVRSRNGYYEARGRRPSTPAPTANVPPALTAALGSPLPVSGVQLRVFAAAFKGEAPNAAVALAVEVDPKDLAFVEKDGIFNEQVQVTYTATDMKGKVFPGDRHTLTLTLKPDTYKRTQETGVRMLSQMNLPPGRYQVRVAASNAAGEAGSVLYDLDVPDFSKAPLTMSGVAIASARTSGAPTAKPKDPLASFLPGPPTATREFAVGDTLAMFTEFYENARGAAHMLDFKVELRAEGGQAVYQSADQRSSTELQGSAGGYGFAATIPLTGIQPGLYVLHVEGQSRAGDRPVASRDVLLRVR